MNLVKSGLLLAGIIINSGLWAQISLSGRVVNTLGGSIPYAHIQIVGRSAGTSSNQDGYFTLHNSQQDQGMVVKCSAVGYVSKELAFNISQRGILITLEENVVELQTVTVTPVDHALKLAMAVISNIPQNYPDRRESLKVFSRMSAYSDSSRNDPYYVIEALMAAQKEPYLSAVSKKSGHVQMLKNRKYEFSNIDSLAVRFYGGTHSVHWSDLVAYRAGPLSQPNDYKFEITDTLSLDGTIIYELRFDSKSSGRGVMLIEANSYALTQMTLHHNVKESNGLGVDILETLRGYDRIFRKYEARYSQSDDKWRIKSANYESAFQHEDRIKIFIKDEVIVTNYVSRSEDIPYQERFDSKKPLIVNIGEYDSMFWEGYNHIIPDKQLVHHLQTASIKDPNEKTKQEKIIRILKRFQIHYGIIGINSNAFDAKVDYQTDFSFNSEYSGVRRLIPGLETKISYELKPNLFAGFETSGSFKKSVFSAGLLTSHYDFNIRKNSRPVYISPSIKFGYLAFRQKLGSAPSESNFMLNGRKFDSNQIDIYLEQRSLIFSPSLTISLEKNSRLGFYFEGGYNFRLSTDNGLYIQEHQFFLKRKSSFVSPSNKNLDLTLSNQSLHSHSPYASFGIRFGL